MVKAGDKAVFFGCLAVVPDVGSMTLPTRVTVNQGAQVQGAAVCCAVQVMRAHEARRVQEVKSAGSSGSLPIKLYVQGPS